MEPSGKRLRLGEVPEEQDVARATPEHRSSPTGVGMPRSESGALPAPELRTDCPDRDYWKGVDDVTDFALSPVDPARSKFEAVTRMSALVGGETERLGPGSKERKSALITLTHGLGLTVDESLSKPELGGQIAGLLGCTWDERCWSTGSTITLFGLNQLLAAGKVERDRQNRAAAPQAFTPARSKIEAVTRISALVDGTPERLGPGSKERKSALIQLATGLRLDVDTTVNKPELGEAIATTLRQAWTASCWSRGHTITLTGLNVLIAGAEQEINRRRPGGVTSVATSPRHEAEGILEAIAHALPQHMDGRACVNQMRAAEYPQWAQDEWAGFYLEFVGLPACINAFGVAPSTFANTRFDYALGQVWDFKLHASRAGTAPLNAIDGVRACLGGGQGLGFVVLSGEVEYDDGSFRQWQREQRIAAGKKPATRSSPPSYVRKSKPSFTPNLLEAYHLRNESVLEKALADLLMTVMQQGRQASGRPRRPKYGLDLTKARRSPVLLASRPL